MPESRVYNTAARPRIVIRGFADKPELRARIAALAPTSVHVESLTEVNQNEWDVLVTDTRVDEQRSGRLGHVRLRAADHLHVVLASRATFMGRSGGSRQHTGNGPAKVEPHKERAPPEC